MNKTAILENLTQCRVDLRAAIIELDRVRPEKRKKETEDRTPSMRVRSKALTG